MTPPAKCYCYVDESGQDTKGQVFVVAVVIADQRRNELEALLERFERESGKGRVKWLKAEYKRRLAYLTKVASSEELKGSLFYRVTEGIVPYLETTAESTAAAAQTWLKQRKLSEYQVRVVVDGLKKSERSRMRMLLSRLGLKRVSAIGARDESTALVRLADAIAGLARSAALGDRDSKTFFRNLLKRDVLKEV